MLFTLLLFTILVGGSESANAHPSSDRDSTVHFVRQDIKIQSQAIEIHYRVEFPLPAQQLRQRLTDYGRFAEISPLIVASEVTQTPEGQVLDQVYRPCILGICYALHKRQILSQDAQGGIHARILAKGSHFTAGYEHWRITAKRERSLLTYTARLKPSFPVPPIIGPLIGERFLKKEFNTVALNLISER